MFRMVRADGCSAVHGEYAPEPCASRNHAKKKSFKPIEQDRQDVQEKRRIFEKTLANIEPERLVFIDESGCNIAMTMAHARAPAGERVAEKRPTNWGQNITIVGAIRPDRVLCHQVLQGSMNKVRFIDFVENTLCPRLEAGNVVILDNLRAHHATEVRMAIEKRGAEVIYQPPYSPEYNPIELCWSFIKGWLRRLAKRTEVELRRAIRTTFLRVKTAQLKAWFAHCGWHHSK